MLQMKCPKKVSVTMEGDFLLTFLCPESDEEVTKRWCQIKLSKLLSVPTLFATKISPHFSLMLGNVYFELLPSADAFDPMTWKVGHLGWFGNI